MAEQLDFPGLLEEMKGKRTTNGFDVLVSYSQDKVNEILKTRSQELTSILDTGRLQTSYVDPVTDDPVDVFFDLKLNHPLLRFEDEHANVTLTFDIQEGYWEAGASGKKKPILKGTVLCLSTNLVSVSGTVDSSQSKSEFAGQEDKTAPPNYTVILNPDEKSISQGVCISFKKASAELTGTTEEAKKVAKTLQSLIKGALEQYFSDAAEFKYFIAGVSNQYNPGSMSHPLRPRSFCFTTVQGKEKGDIKAALSMWISVEGGPSGGTMPTGNTSVSFHPRERDLIPIASGTTSSLIVSNDLLVNQFLKPNLAKGFDNVEDVTSPGQAGLRFTGKMKASNVDIPMLDEYKRGPSNNPWVQRRKMDGIKFSPSDPVTTIDFSGEINAKSNKVRYTREKQRAKWITEDYDGGEDAQYHSGTTKIDFVWTAKGSWEDKSNASQPNLLGFDWIGDVNWTLNMSEEDRSGLEKFLHIPPNETPEHFKSMKVPGPNVSLRMESLDYFLTTNLLYPGKYIFKGDDPAVESTTKGLALPRDLILTGEIKT